MRLFVKAHATGYPLEGRGTFQGLKISIENRAGSVRRGTNRNGSEWATLMRHPYGYIRLTEGVDGDHLDCYIGPNPHSELVFIVNQIEPATGEFDEQKVMLGFDSVEDARHAYLLHYDDERFLGDIVTMSMEEFRRKALDRASWGRVVKAQATEAAPEDADPDNEPEDVTAARAALAAVTGEIASVRHDRARVRAHTERLAQHHTRAADGLADAIRDPRDSALQAAYLEHTWEATRARALLTHERDR